MNRAEFMNQLNYLLQDVAESEREEALMYYGDYFNDAGSENEEIVMRELGSPERVAAIIKAGMSGEYSGEFTEHGYEDARYREQGYVAKRAFEENTNKSEQTRNAKNTDYTNNEKKDNFNWQADYDWREEGGYRKSHKWKWDSSKIILVVIACFILIPIGLPIIGVVFGLVVGALGLLFGGAMGVGGLTIGLICSGIGIFIKGIFTLFSSPMGGVFMAGSGLVLIALGLLFLILTLKIFLKLIPAVIRLITGLIHKIFRRGGRCA